MILRQVELAPPSMAADMVNECMHYTVKLQHNMSDEDAISAFRQAWIALHHDHPAIAATFEQGKRIYSSVDNDTIRDWVVETFHVHETCFGASDIYPTIPGTRRVDLHLFPTTKEMMLQASHEHVDGQGMLGLIDKMLSYVKDPVERCLVGHEGNLSPPLEVAAGIVGEASETIWHEMRESLREWLRMGQNPLTIRTEQRGFVLAETSEDAEGVRPAMRRLSLSEEMTMQLAQAAKEAGVNLRDLSHAATIIAVRELEGRHAGRNWTGGIARNVRSLCKPPFNSLRAHPAANYFGGALVYLENPIDVWDTARELKKQRERLKADTHVLDRINPLHMLLSNMETTRPARPREEVDNHNLDDVVVAPVHYIGMGKLDSYFSGGHPHVRVLEFSQAYHKCTTAVSVACHGLHDCLYFDISYTRGLTDHAKVLSYSRHLALLLDSLAAGYTLRH